MTTQLNGQVWLSDKFLCTVINYCRIWLLQFERCSALDAGYAIGRDQGTCTDRQCSRSQINYYTIIWPDRHKAHWVNSLRRDFLYTDKCDW